MVSPQIGFTYSCLVEFYYVYEKCIKDMILSPTRGDVTPMSLVQRQIQDGEHEGE